MSETWKEIKGYEGIYEISTKGRVRRRKKNGKINYIRPVKRKDGYCQVSLYNGGVQKHITIHRLVANAFLENTPDKNQVNHIDGVKENNTVENLEWCTAKENIAHSYYVLKRNTKPVICIETGVVYPSLRSAARSIGYDYSTIQKICAGKGKCKTTRGLHWRYV